MNKIFKLFFCLLLCSCAPSLCAQNQITDFDSCVAAGNPVLRSYPAKCVAQGVGTFVQKIPNQRVAEEPKVAEPLVYKKLCKDLCGNGSCEEMVCMAEGCPCAESQQSCPADCK